MDMEAVLAIWFENMSYELLKGHFVFLPHFYSDLWIFF